MLFISKSEYAKMNAAEDDDLKLQRASASALSDLEKLLLRILRKSKNGSATGDVRQSVKIVDMYRAFALVLSPCFLLNVQGLIKF